MEYRSHSKVHGIVILPFHLYDGTAGGNLDGKKVLLEMCERVCNAGLKLQYVRLIKSRRKTTLR